MPNESQEKTGALTENGHAGAILGLLVVVLIFIVGGLYLWGAMIAKNENQAQVERAIPNNEPETTRANTDRQILDTTSASLEIDAIYADLESTNLNDLDAELNSVEAEMNAALR
jgi:hypothetical protein